MCIFLQAVIYIKKRIISIIFVLAVAAAVLSTRYLGAKEHTRTIYGCFDTICTITTYSSSDKTEEYENLLRDAELKFSAYNPQSEIYRLNSDLYAELSPDTVSLLCDAVTYSNLLSNYFDITLNPVCLLWQEAEKNSVLPLNIDSALSLKGTENIYIDIDSNYAKILKEGASITLGAIAKGYVTDRIVQKMRANGETSALINLGGNIYAYGLKNNSTAWQIGIRDPKSDENSSAAIVEASNISIVTSGAYQRGFELDGKWYHHIIDPKTGYPAENGIISATAIGSKSELCDILSTAMYVAGVENAFRLAEEYGIDAIIITDNTIYYSKGLDGKIKPSGNNYNFVLYEAVQ